MTCITSILVNPAILVLKEGEWYYDISVTISPENADCKCVTWHSDDPTVVAVSQESGYFYAVAPGTTTVYAIACDGSGVRGVCYVIVKEQSSDTSIEITSENKTLYLGETVTLTTNIPVGDASNLTLTWTSSNETVATVNSNGKVIPIAEGTVTITVETNDGAMDSHTLTVKSKVTVISCLKDTWQDSSETMGEAMANAYANPADPAVKTPTNAVEFESCWNTAGECVIIHTHGSPNLLAGQIADNSQPNIIYKTEIANLERNNDIHFVMMTACETAGGTPEDNVAYWLSKKINSTGIVIANSDRVSGTDTSFYGSNLNATWKVYQNGQLLNMTLPVTLTMEDAYQIYRSLA